MIEYENDFLTMDISCDGRGNSEDCNDVATYVGTWQECIDQAKEDGWIIFKDRFTDEWVHRCPDCKRPRVDELFKD